MDYSELITILRKIVDGDESVLFIDPSLLSASADAIEALSASVEGFEAQTNMVLDRDSNNTVIRFEPRWVPVTERLPEKTGTYLAWMKWDLTEADEEPRAYPVLYDADAEGFGWWKSYYDGDTLGWAGEDFVRYEGITHWMSLPQPPEEE